MPATPSTTPLLDRKTRAELKLYSTLGYVGKVITEALAYIAVLEEELARREEREKQA